MSAYYLPRSPPPATGALGLTHILKSKDIFHPKAPNLNATPTAHRQHHSTASHTPQHTSTAPAPHQHRTADLLIAKHSSTMSSSLKPQIGPTRCAIMCAIQAFEEDWQNPLPADGVEPLASTLRELGYDIATVKTLANVSRALQECAAECSKNASYLRTSGDVIVYVSTHGVRLSGDEGLLLADAPKDECLHLGKITNTSLTRGNLNVLFIIDACCAGDQDPRLFCKTMLAETSSPSSITQAYVATSHAYTPTPTGTNNKLLTNWVGLSQARRWSATRTL